jgi:hypothetical protein
VEGALPECGATGLGEVFAKDATEGGGHVSHEGQQVGGFNLERKKFYRPKEGLFRHEQNKKLKNVLFIWNTLQSTLLRNN